MANKTFFVLLAFILMFAAVTGLHGQLGPTPGKVKTNPKDGLKYVWIPPGTFLMGCSSGDTECANDEKPPHKVTITKGFWLGQTEVTVGAYKRYTGSTGRKMPPDPNANWADASLPVVSTDWNEAKAYCAWAGGRLPTEAEWEYAARAGSTEARYGPLDEVTWYDKGRDWGRLSEVAQKRANPWGLFDALGNVWEWVNDRYDGKYYSSSPSADPSGPASGQERVLRGGSFLGGWSSVRVSSRLRATPTSRSNGEFGLRCIGEVFGH